MHQRMMTYFLIAVLLALSSCGGPASRRMGEVYVYKAVPRDAVISTDRSAAVYMLRGPGYPANENANRIFDMFNTFGHVGPSILMKEASRLYEEASREYLIRFKSGEGNSPTAKSLNEIAAESQLILEELNAQFVRTKEYERNRETALVESISSLVQTRHYILSLDDDLRDLYGDLYDNNRWIPWNRRKESLSSKFPLFITIGGQPLPNQTWTYMEDPGKLWPSNQEAPRWVIDDAFAEFLKQALPLTWVDGEMVSLRRRERWVNLLKEAFADVHVKDADPVKELTEFYDQFVTEVTGTVKAMKNTNETVLSEELKEFTGDKKLRDAIVSRYKQLCTDVKQSSSAEIVDNQKQLYAQLGKDLHDIVENVLALQSGMQYQWGQLPRISYYDYKQRERESLELLIPGINDNRSEIKFEHNMVSQSDLDAWNDLKKLKAEKIVEDKVGRDLQSKWAQRVVEVMPYKSMINRIQNGSRSALYLINEILNSYKAEMALLAREYINEKVRLESLVKHFDQLVPRHPNRKLIVVKDAKKPPTRLTVLMKTLYIRYLSEGSTNVPPEERGTELLVTCEVESAEDVGDSTVMPLVYEPHYSPSNFVNVRDRIIYGPKTYKGDFFNVKISIVELDDLNNSAISSGLDQAVDVVGKAKPELSAISPFVTTFFKGIINGLMENDIELKFEFTIPGPEGKGKADVDMLVAETGHYIILKRENDTRKEYHVEKARIRYGPNDLIYNPEDGLLYYRLDMENPRNNFNPDNLFKEQTYMVLVVTDEYATEDNLGMALRKRLAQTLGEDRSRQLIPDFKSAQKMLDNYSETQQQLSTPANANLDGREKRLMLNQVQSQQDSLWSSNSELNKAVIVRSLFEQSAPRARQLLKENLESWKKAILVVNDNGLIDVE